MSETKHTPGPWTVREYPHLAHPFTKSLYEIEFGGEGELICDTVYERSDANLIAAAPDMLAALKAFPMFDDEDESYSHWRTRVSEWQIKVSEPAIAKAKGGAR